MSKMLERIAEQLNKLRAGMKQLKDMETKLMESAYEEVAKTKSNVVTDHGVFTFIKAGTSTKVDYKKYIIDKGIPAKELETYSKTSPVVEHIKFTPSSDKEVTAKVKPKVVTVTKAETSMFDSE